MRFASRMTSMRASKIREFFDKGRSIPGAIDLSIGQAHFGVPEPVRRATIEAIKAGCGRYSATEGYREVVEATTAYLRDHYSLGLDQQVMLTTGATGAITLAMHALVGPGDEVLLPDPYFVVYRNIINIAGATPVFYDIYPDFRLYLDRIEEQITPRTRLLVLNSPANPTGATLDASELEAVAALCRRNGISVLSDELYGVFCYEDPHVSIKRFLGPESILVGGVSKAFGMAGWRLGWAAAAPEVIDHMRTLQQFMYTCPPTLVQHGTMAAFDLDMSSYVDDARSKRDMIYQGLVDAGYVVNRPTGSFFAFPEVPWGNDLSFCEAALEQKLVLVPGRAFSRRDTHFRIAFAQPNETLERGIEVLARLAKR